MLKPNPMSTKATPNIMIESATTEIASPSETAIVAAMRVWLVFLENLPARDRDTTRHTPNAKYKSKISVSVIPLSFRKAG